MARPFEQKPPSRLRGRVHEVIFETETRAGRLFDVGLLLVIVASVTVVSLESIEAYRLRYGRALWLLEWVFTGLFTVEYALRLYAVRRPWRYARSFFGVVDLLAILPSYVSLLLPGAQSLLVIRVIRLLRVFRVLKMVSFVQHADVLSRALKASRYKITIFVGGVLSVDVIMGALMYLIEGPERGFDSIPRGVYWAIVTMTTVGFGDITPQTPVGQFLASGLMILGYGIIAVPTGIVSVELASASRTVSTQACPACGAEGHDPDAVHCKHCGTLL